MQSLVLIHITVALKLLLVAYLGGAQTSSHSGSNQLVDHDYDYDQQHHHRQHHHHHNQQHQHQYQNEHLHTIQSHEDNEKKPWQRSMPKPIEIHDEQQQQQQQQQHQYHHHTRHNHHHQGDHHRRQSMAAAMSTASPEERQHDDDDNDELLWLRQDDNDDNDEQRQRTRVAGGNGGEDNNGIEPNDYDTITNTDADERRQQHLANKSDPVKNSSGINNNHEQPQQPKQQPYNQQHHQQQPAKVSSDSRQALDPSQLSAYQSNAHSLPTRSRSGSIKMPHHQHAKFYDHHDHRHRQHHHHGHHYSSSPPPMATLMITTTPQTSIDDYYDEHSEDNNKGFKDFDEYSQDDFAPRNDHFNFNNDNNNNNNNNNNVYGDIDDDDTDDAEIASEYDTSISHRPPMRVTRDHRQNGRPYLQSYQQHHHHQQQQQQQDFVNNSVMQENEHDYADDEPYREAPSGGGSPSGDFVTGDLTQQKINELGTKEAVRQAHANHQLMRSSNDYSRMQRQYQLHVSRVANAIKCRLPQPRVVPIVGDPSKLYQPSCTVVYRCGPDTGCCSNLRQVCTNRSYEIIQVYVAAINTDTQRREIEMKTFENHTECGCVNSSRAKRSDLQHARLDHQPPHREQTQQSHNQEMQQDEQYGDVQLLCQCPTHFNARDRDESLRPSWLSSGLLLQHHGQQHGQSQFHQQQPKPTQCRCNCAWGHMPCQRQYSGDEGFSIEDRKCIAERRCQSPMCQYGVYNELSGRCPRAHKRTVTHHNYGIG